MGYCWIQFTANFATHVFYQDCLLILNSQNYSALYEVGSKRRGNGEVISIVKFYPNFYRNSGEADDSFVEC